MRPSKRELSSALLDRYTPHYAARAANNTLATGEQAWLPRQASSAAPLRRAPGLGAGRDDRSPPKPARSTRQRTCYIYIYVLHKLMLT